MRIDLSNDAGWSNGESSFPKVIWWSQRQKSPGWSHLVYNHVISFSDRKILTILRFLELTIPMPLNLANFGIVGFVYRFLLALSPASLNLVFFPMYIYTYIYNLLQKCSTFRHGQPNNFCLVNPWGLTSWKAMLWYRSRTQGLWVVMVTSSSGPRLCLLFPFPVGSMGLVCWPTRMVDFCCRCILWVYFLLGWEISKDIDTMRFINNFASSSKNRMFNI